LDFDGFVAGATLAVALRGREGTTGHMLVQGTAWIDEKTSIGSILFDCTQPNDYGGEFQQGTAARRDECPMAVAGSHIELHSVTRIAQAIRISHAIERRRPDILGSSF